MPYRLNGDIVKEMPARCVAMRKDMITRQANPHEPGFTLFPNHHFDSGIRKVSVSPSEFDQWKASKHPPFIAFNILICGDYQFTFAPDIHSTNLIYTLATTDVFAAGTPRIKILPQDWDTAFNPAIGTVGLDKLRLYQEPFGDTYAN